MKSLLLTAACILLPLLALAAEDDSDASPDSAKGLPKEYGDFLLASATLSPEKDFAVIYPTLGVCEPDSAPRCRDYLVQLDPFKILTKLETKYPYFQNQNHGGLSAAWADDQSAVLVTLESKWGPGDIILCQLADGKVTQSTNLLQKAHDLLLPSFKKSQPTKYNDDFDFIFEPDEDNPEMPVCQFTDSGHIRVHGVATNDPKGVADHPWTAKIEATWDIAAAKFTAQKISK